MKNSSVTRRQFVGTMGGAAALAMAPGHVLAAGRRRAAGES